VTAQCLLGVGRRLYIGVAHHEASCGLRASSQLKCPCCHPQNTTGEWLLQGRFPCPDQVHIGQDAMLYINHADVQVRSLDLRGALVVEGQQDVDITIDGLQVDNAGWQWHALQDTDNSKEHQKIRCALLQALRHVTDASYAVCSGD